MRFTFRLSDLLFVSLVGIALGCIPLGDALLYGSANPNANKLPPPTTQQSQNINDVNARLDRIEGALETIKQGAGGVAVVAPGNPASSTAAIIAAVAAGALGVERLLRTYVAPVIKGAGAPQAGNGGTSPSVSGTVTQRGVMSNGVFIPDPQPGNVGTNVPVT